MPVFYGSVEEFLVQALERLRAEIYDVVSVNLLGRLVAACDGSSMLIVEQVEDKISPVVSNMLYSREALYHALNVEHDREAYAKLLGAMHGVDGQAIVWRDFREFYKSIDVDLTRLPLTRFYEEDEGRHISSTIFIACHGDACNASVHRTMVLDRREACVRVVPRHLYKLLRDAGGRLPVAVVTGVHPLVMLASALSPPLGVFELSIVGKLVGAPLAMCRTPRYGLPVPCGASLVFEGVLVDSQCMEGPYVDVLELVDEVRLQPKLLLEQAYINTVFTPYVHVLMPGSMEHKLLMGFPREALIYDAVSRVTPNVVKVRLTPASGMWLHAVVSIAKTREGEAVNVGLAALAAHPSLKHVIVVDDDIDPDKPGDVEWALATRLQGDRGIIVVRGAAGSTLDPSAGGGVTAKVVIDATAPLKSRERFRRARRLKPCT